MLKNQLSPCVLLSMAQEYWVVKMTRKNDRIAEMLVISGAF
jgi:hypothetical protein